MNKKYIPLFVVLFILCITTALYINRDYLFKNDDVNIEDNNKVDVDKDDIILDIIEEEIDDKVEEDETNDEDETIDITGEENKENSDTDNNNSINSNNNQTKPNDNKNNNQSKPSKPSKNETIKDNDSTKDEINEDNDSTKDETNEDNDSSNNDSGSNNTSDNNDSNNDNDDTIIEDTEDIIPTQEELNDKYRKQLQDTYNIRIAYGEEMGNYLVASYSPTKMTDDNTINEYLKRIENELKKYPIGFFKEMKDYGMPLTLYIVKDIPGSGISGLTDSQLYSNIIITIKESLLFEKTMNHEIMHYIDAYLNSKLYPNTVEIEWNKLNPIGFSYGVFDTTYDYFPTQNNNAYFFSNYAQTNYKEDRATLFEDIMTETSPKLMKRWGGDILGCQESSH